MPVFVGCDLGTMGTKAAVVDEKGDLIGAAFVEAPLHSPQPGSVQQDLEEIERSAQRALKAALAQSGRAHDVAGIAFSGQMSGVGAVRADFTPAFAFDSWLDSRCATQIHELAAHAELITSVSGCPPTYSHGPKLRHWLADPERDTSEVAKLVVPGSYVAARMGGLSTREAFIDRTYLHFSNMANTPQETWAPELVELVGIDDSWLPRIVKPVDIVGEVTASAADATGLPRNTPIAAGAGDQAAAQLGAAALRPGIAFDSAGTASVFAVTTSEFRPDTRAFRRLAANAVVDGVYVALSFINGGGLALKWFRDEVAAELRDDPAAFTKLDELAASVAPGCGGLLWYPHLQGRVLPPDPACRGAWVGVTSGHTIGHLYRAILEGIALEYALWVGDEDSDDPLVVRHARALGGGARSPLWNQIKADVLGVEWVRLVREEAAVLGDALIAAAATGHVHDLVGTAEEWQALGPVARPSPANTKVYRHLLGAYRTLADAFPAVFEKLSETHAEE